MKIGQFSDSFIPIVDGVGRVVYNYCDTLGKMGEEVSAIVPMEDMGYRGKYPFEIIDYFSKNLPNTSYNAGVPLADIHFDEELKMKRFDIVHVHTPFIAGIEGIRYAKKHNVPVIGSFHSKYYDDFFQLTKSKHIATIGTDVVVKFYEKCDEVWTVSENSAETLKSYGYSKPIYVIQNGMDIKDVDYSLAIKAKKEYKLSDDPILLYVGQLNWKKNILRTLEALALLSRNNYKYQFILAGMGPHKSEIEVKAKELGIIDNIIFTGHILDENLLYGLYALADLFVFPSNYDTYSMVVREAANARTPSLVLKDSAPSECIKDKENGLLCLDNSEDMYNVLKDVINDRDYLIKLGINAKNTIPVSWDEIMKQVLNRYQYIIEKH